MGWLSPACEAPWGSINVREKKSVEDEVAGGIPGAAQ